ncbi:Bicarbonate transport ATP-binding protein CmpD [Jannaschia donghaensis]|uniref:Bicarbonate transport ATP-binding protein CmpD n=1 Tax=Jannaschia donghaensis TaxID=420998 RepID=A0A0M6YKL5_9RHOB|nr:ABC transporter ATP-binding protein [Jannaschia donghaensis]CTQ49807.1 Bicarbonate transport ATP-binding protein CmpD [Jannaschia donghaensis]
MSLPISLEHVTHAYSTAAGPLPVLKDLSIDMPEGSFTAVVGPSGCGKSTLTRLIAGLMKPDQGIVRLGGAPVTGPRSTVGMAFQNPVLLEWRTILQNVMLPLEIVSTSMSKTQQQDRARELLALVGLEGFEDKKPSELSGGMRQRASLCRSIVHRPEVLILDEPFGALDAFTREDLWQTMHELRAKEQFTCVLITHDLRESVFLSDRTVVFSARPAFAQRVVEIDMGGRRTLDDLYAPRAVELLAVLRREIQVAQGRDVDPPAASPVPVPGVANRPVEHVAATAQDPSTEAPR